LAENIFQEYRLPQDFAERCICGCTKSGREEVRKMTKNSKKSPKKKAKVKGKNGCYCGCWPPSAKKK
jgi:hypothetical protein